MPEKALACADSDPAGHSNLPQLTSQDLNVLNDPPNSRRSDSSDPSDTGSRSGHHLRARANSHDDRSSSSDGKNVSQPRKLGERVNGCPSYYSQPAGNGASATVVPPQCMPTNSHARGQQPGIHPTAHLTPASGSSTNRDMSEPHASLEAGQRAVPETGIPSCLSIGGHHLSFAQGDQFLKQSCSRREERFYEGIQFFQGRLMVETLRHLREAASPTASMQNKHTQRDLGTSPSCEAAALNDTEIPVHMRQAAARLWWTVKPANYNRMDITTYRVQERASASMPPSPFLQSSDSIAPQDPSCSWDLASQALSTGRLDVVMDRERQRALELLAPFVPRFCGLRRMRAEEVLSITRNGSSWSSLGRPSTDALCLTKGAESEHPGSDTGKDAVTCNENDNIDVNGAEKVWDMIALENVCHGFVYPCVLDVKMGVRQHGLHPTPAKRASKELKARLSTSAKYGIRLAGYKRWDPQQQRYVEKSKRDCRHLSLAEVKECLFRFCLGQRQFQDAFRKQLEQLRIAFSQQMAYRFFTSSLLFVYDATRPLETCRIVMVDFAYTYARDELQRGGDAEAEYDYDVGYIKALDTLLSLLV